MRWKIVASTITTGILAGIAAVWVWDGRYAANPNPAQQIPAPRQAEAFILPVANPNYFPIRDFNVAEPSLTAVAAALYDVESDKFLFTKNMHQRMSVASITKLMTAIIVLENLDLGSIITVRVEDTNADGLGADFTPGEQLIAGDIFKMMLIKSSNDAGLILASEAERRGIDLVKKMNEKAAEIGMPTTRFSDPTGLDDAGTFSTVNDLIKLVRYVNKYPLIWSTLTTPSATVTSIDGMRRHYAENTNKLLGIIPNIVGGKTGFTDVAGESMVLEAGINGNENHLISIILGSQDRFGETKKLIDWSMRAYSWK